MWKGGDGLIRVKCPKERGEGGRCGRVGSSMVRLIVRRFLGLGTYLANAIEMRFNTNLF